VTQPGYRSYATISGWRDNGQWHTHVPTDELPTVCPDHAYTRLCTPQRPVVLTNILSRLHVTSIQIGPVIIPVELPPIGEMRASRMQPWLYDPLTPAEVIMRNYRPYCEGADSVEALQRVGARALHLNEILVQAAHEIRVHLHNDSDIPNKPWLVLIGYEESSNP
jgi:hypothetical protein